MTKKDRKQLYSLLKRWTKAQIMARYSPFVDFRVWGTCFQDSLEMEDKIRKLLYGTANLYDLGLRWGLPIDYQNKPKRKKSTKKFQKKHK